MASAAPKQDMPPPGGYNPIPYKRVPPRVYFGGFAILGGYLGMTAGAAFLYYLNCKTNYKEEIEMRSGRFAIQPLLMAERDREYLKQLRRNRDEEAELMKDVEGWKVGHYYDEPLYKTLPKDRLHPDMYQGYYAHASPKDYYRRANLAAWS